jgi:hypothetical protein
MEMCWNVWFRSSFEKRSPGGGTHFLYASALTLCSRKLLFWCPGQPNVCRETGRWIGGIISPRRLAICHYALTSKYHSNIDITFFHSSSCWYDKKPPDRCISLLKYVVRFSVMYEAIVFFGLPLDVFHFWVILRHRQQLRLYRIELLDDSWMMNCKVFGRKRSWPSRGTTSTFVWRDWNELKIMNSGHLSDRMCICYACSTIPFLSL